MSNYSFNNIAMQEKKFTRNKEEKIDLIYSTFFNLILKKGYHKTSTNHVAKAARISIGTIYKYFPNGKEDIIRNYFEDSMDSVLKIDDMLNINDNNIRDFLRQFITKLYKFHVEKQGYNLAFRSAIQTDKALLDAHKEKLFTSFKDIAQELRKENESFEKIPEDKLIKIFVFLYNLVNAIIFHHLSMMKLFDTDDKLTEYIFSLVVFSLNYFVDK